VVWRLRLRRGRGSDGFVFFFSSRRRHTRSYGDWSSDVCSSDLRAGRLSGGLKRRLNLAIGLLVEPEILLLDEPTAGVDPQARAFLLESIRSLTGAGRTILYTSHYMEEVEAICDRVAIIDHGRVLVSGALSEVTRDGSGLQELFMQLTHRSLRD